MSRCEDNVGLTRDESYEVPHETRFIPSCCYTYVIPMHYADCCSRHNKPMYLRQAVRRHVVWFFTF